VQQTTVRQPPVPQPAVRSTEDLKLARSGSGDYHGLFDGPSTDSNFSLLRMPICPNCVGPWAGYEQDRKGVFCQSPCSHGVGHCSGDLPKWSFPIWTWLVRPIHACSCANQSPAVDNHQRGSGSSNAKPNGPAVEQAPKPEVRAVPRNVLPEDLE
jgi:hypothetical protein